MHAHTHTRTYLIQFISSSEEITPSIVVMPLLDGDDRVVGFSLMESRETGDYMRCYLVCDFSSHKLRMYPEEAEFDSDLSKYTPFAEINTQYITKVSPLLSEKYDTIYHVLINL